MKLYYRQLNNLDELKQERRLLQKQAKKKEKKSGENTGKDNILDSLLSEGGLWTSIASVLPQLLKFFPLKGKKSKILSIGTDIMLGYIKWQMVRYGIRFIRSFMQKTRPKQESSS